MAAAVQVLQIDTLPLPGKVAASRQQRARAAWAEAKAIIIQHWVPITFAVAIIWALSWPSPGTALLHITILGDVRIIQEVSMGVVFFISGLTLSTQDLKKAKGHAWGVVYGLFAILFLTPCLGFVIREIPLEPKLFTIGLTMFCVAPTTLGVGIALVRSAKGNDGVALLMTIVSNLLGVVTMPFALKLLFYNYDLSGLDIKVDILNLFVKLIITILGPSVLGKGMRELWPAAMRMATKYKLQLNLLSTAALAFIVWQTLSGACNLLFESHGGMIVCVIIIAIAMYLFFLLINFLVVCYIFRMPTPEAIAVVIISSQKSAPVAVTVISYITGDPATQGLLAIPPIVSQLTQIFLGAAMAPPIARRGDAYEKRIADEAAAAAAASEAAAGGRGAPLEERSVGASGAQSGEGVVDLADVESCGLGDPGKGSSVADGDVAKLPSGPLKSQGLDNIQLDVDKYDGAVSHDKRTGSPDDGEGV